MINYEILVLFAAVAARTSPVWGFACFAALLIAYDEYKTDVAKRD